MHNRSCGGFDPEKFAKKYTKMCHEFVHKFLATDDERKCIMCNCAERRYKELHIGRV
jgi:hypothetical protein